MTYTLFTGHSNGDRLGYDVGGAGDFDGDGHHDLAILARYDDQPSNKNAYSHDGTCGGSRNTRARCSSSRALAMRFQTASRTLSGMAQTGQSIRYLASGLDINGDGFSDFVAGGPDWDRQGANTAGGFSVVLGRPKDSSGKPNIICANALDFVGLAASDYLVHGGLTSLGDVNQDGCDDFAVGARAEDIPTGSQGSARVFFGWGGPAV